MAARAKGRPTSSFTQDQLQAMGAKDMTHSYQGGPPPIFPPLASKPVKLDSSPDIDYKILWKEDFTTYLKESPYYLNLKNTSKKLERYSDKLVNVIDDSTSTEEPNFYWPAMPLELRPNFKRSKVTPASTVPAKKIKSVDIEKKLKDLEQKEAILGKQTEIKEEPASDEEEKEVEPEVQEDSEMDDENDYGVSYFDNGESYYEEEGLDGDEGPVY